VNIYTQWPSWISWSLVGLGVLTLGYELRSVSFLTWLLPRPNARVPLKDMLDAARHLGWDFDSERSLQIFDFCASFRQAALDGDVRSWGRPMGGHMFEEVIRNQPLHEIPREHWRTFQLEEVSLLTGEDNYRAQSYDIVGHTKGFADLHVMNKEAMKWLKKKAIHERGKKQR
jgi:hypothetical protein